MWEFWKKDSELFPNEIFNATEAGLESIPHGLVFVFDGSNDDLFQEEEIPFYKELVKISLKKGYENIHVILTRIDVFEKNEEISVRLDGGTLKIKILDDNSVIMTGPAEFICEGYVNC